MHTIPADQIIIYSSDWCGFCARAKKLLRQKEVAFEERNVDGDSAVRTAMSDLAKGATSVPQIWIYGTHIGGSDDLIALDASGQLDKLLASS